MSIPEILVAAVIVIPTIVVVIALRIWGLRIQWEFLKTAYSKKRFDELTATSKEVDLKKFQRLARTYTIVVCVMGIGLLWLYSISGHIGLLLWGLSAVLVASCMWISLFTTVEKDLQWTKKTESQLHFARYLVMASPIVVGIGFFLLPKSSQLFDKYAILNMFGLLALGISVAVIPFAIRKIEKLLTSTK